MASSAALHHEHQRALLNQGRCLWCAERVPAGLVLRGGSCGSCGRGVRCPSLPSEELLAGVQSRWRRFRWPIYGGVAVSTALASVVPFLGALVFAVAMLSTNLLLVRRPARWLGLRRRILTRLTLSLFLALLTAASLVASALLLVLPVLGQLGTGLLSLLLAVIYVEGALAWIGNRLRLESRQASLSLAEWLLPTLALSTLLGLTALSMLSVVGLLHLLLWAEIPGVAELAAFLLDVGAEP